MPVDTRSKRASSVGMFFSPILTPVLPDGTIAQADRQHIAWTYSGILAVSGFWVGLIQLVMHMVMIHKSGLGMFYGYYGAGRMLTNDGDYLVFD